MPSVQVISADGWRMLNMPLKHGSSKEIISSNIKELISSGYSKEQATAIALHKSKKKSKLKSAMERTK